jgi:hypothetical protein
MRINPNLRGIVYDRPGNSSKAQAVADSLDLSSRSTAVAEDFFESVLQGDFIFRFILHDWNDQDCVRILKNCRRAMLPNGKLAIVESFLGRVDERIADGVGDTQGAIIDFSCVRGGGGRERSVSQYENQLRQADLSITTPLSSGYVLMEAGVRKL